MAKRATSSSALSASSGRRRYGSRPRGGRTAWYDRELFKVWAPISAVTVACIQSTSYFLYRSFFEDLFAVSPEEVGSDYTTLFARNAIVIATLLAVVVLVLVVGTLALAFFARLTKTMWQQSDGNEARTLRYIGYIVVAGLFAPIVTRISSTSLHLPAFLVPIIAGVVFEETRARRRGDNTTWLARLAEDRTYSGFRRLTLIAGTIMAFEVSDLNDKDTSIATIVVVVITVLLADMAVGTKSLLGSVAPVARRLTSAEAKWLEALFFVAIASVLGLVVSIVGPSLLTGGAEERYIRSIAGGEAPRYSYSDPLALLLPPIRDVQVTWIGDDAPQEWSRAAEDSGRRLLYLGAANGVSVFYDASTTEVLRVPTPKVILVDVTTGITNFAPDRAPTSASR